MSYWTPACGLEVLLEKDHRSPSMNTEVKGSSSVSVMEKGGRRQEATAKLIPFLQAAWTY